MPLMIEGTLHARPEYRRGVDGRAIVLLLVRTGAALPIELRLEGPDTPQAHDNARAWAAELMAGESVAARCDGVVRERVDHGVRAALTSNVAWADVAGRSVFLDGQFIAF